MNDPSTAMRSAKIPERAEREGDSSRKKTAGRRSVKIMGRDFETAGGERESICHELGW